MEKICTRCGIHVETFDTNKCHFCGGNLTDKSPTVHEKFALLTGHDEEIHIEALKVLIAELEEKNPGMDLGWCLSKYKGIMEWLQSDACELLKPKEEKNTNRYYVSYSGGTFVNAENEEEACELGTSQIELSDVNAYEVDEEGNIIKP